MKNLVKTALFVVGLLIFASIFSFGQQVKRTPFDVTNYVIDASLSPVENKLTATADVTFTPLEDARNVTFELNGSLKVDTITRVGAPGASQAAAKPSVKKTATPAGQPGAAAPAPAGEITLAQAAGRPAAKCRGRSLRWW